MNPTPVGSPAPQRIQLRHDLAGRAGAAVRVLRIIDQPDTSAKDLAEVIGADPVLAARILRTANSTFYGLSGRVSTLSFAVLVMGFQGVRSIAAMTAVSSDGDDAAPEGFWTAASLCAAGGEIVAPMLGADPGDAFTVGLLHPIGTAVLHQAAPAEVKDRVGICLGPGCEEALDWERQAFAISHQQAGADVLRAWHVPEQLCATIERHHQAAMPDAPGLERTLQIVRYLAAAELSGQGPSEDDAAACAWLSEGVIGRSVAESVAERMRSRAAALVEALQP